VVYAIFVSIMEIQKHSNSLKKKEILKSRDDIKQLFESGKRSGLYPIRIVWQLLDTSDNSPQIQVLFSVSKKKFRNAVDRNRVKRLLREMYRLNKEQLFDLMKHQYPNKKLHLAFIFGDAQMPSYELLQAKFPEALKRLSNLLLKYNKL